jgi:carbon starvation protein CstA
MDQLQILIIGTSIYWGYFTVSSQEVSTMALAISFLHVPKMASFFADIPKIPYFLFSYADT